MYCSMPLEYTIRGVVIIVATVVDVMLIKGCRISVREVVGLL